MNEAGVIMAHNEHLLPDHADTHAYEFDLRSDPEANIQQNTSLLERIAWFRDLPIKGKIQVILGAFFGVCLVMAAALTFGLTELYLRYQTLAEVNAGLLASAKLHNTTGELRYNSVRVIFALEEEGMNRQSKSFAVAKAQLDEVDNVVKKHIPQLSERLKNTRSDFIQYSMIFDSLTENLETEGRSKKSVELAYNLSDQGDKLFNSADEFAQYF